MVENIIHFNTKVHKFWTHIAFLRCWQVERQVRRMNLKCQLCSENELIRANAHLLGNIAADALSLC